MLQPRLIGYRFGPPRLSQNGYDYSGYTSEWAPAPDTGPGAAEYTAADVAAAYAPAAIDYYTPPAQAPVTMTPSTPQPSIWDSILTSAPNIIAAATPLIAATAGEQPVVYQPATATQPARTLIGAAAVQAARPTAAVPGTGLFAPGGLLGGGSSTMWIVGGLVAIGLVMAMSQQKGGTRRRRSR